MSTQVLALNCLVPGQNLESYIQTVNTLPVLTAEEEARLAHRFRDDGDLDAARQLVMSHLRFVVHLARGYSGYGLPQADLVQEGNIGLMKAVKRFDPAFGVRLVSFAVHWIKAEMHEFILRNWRIVKVATTKAQRKLFFNLRSAKKRLGWMTRAEAESVARDLGVDVADVVQMEGRLAAHDASFDGDVDDEDDWAMSPAQYLPDPNSDPADIVSANDWQVDNVDRLSTALTDLDERSRDIIASRWLADRKSTLHELADRYGVSAERIRQLEKNALRKLRGALEEAVA